MLWFGMLKWLLALAAQAVSVIQLLNRERCAHCEETAFGNAAGEAAPYKRPFLKPKINNFDLFG